MPASAAPVPFIPLAPLLHALAPAKLAEARVRVGRLHRDELIIRFQSAFHAGKRVVSLLCADSLISQGIPPAFWHSSLLQSNFSVTDRFDLFAHDVRWLRAAYPKHARTVRYDRYRSLLTGSETAFHREAEFAFYAGRRPAWKIVGSLSLDESQQMDCRWLRSAPVTRRLKVVTEKRDQVILALSEDLKGVRRTAQFSDVDAVESLLRRHRLWQCAQMADGKPTETARRYSQMTGESISRQVVANQLQKVDAVLRKNEMTSA